MKKKKWLALIVAGALTVSGVGETAGVLAAEFTDEEILEQDAQAEETEQWEDIEAFVDTEPEAIVLEGASLEAEEKQELFKDTVAEENLFSSGEPEEAFADGEPEDVVFAGAAAADYSGMMISEAEFAHLKETGEAPEREWVEESETGFADFMKNFSDKTGYLLVAANNNQGYEDLVIPQGLTVVIACGSGIHIRSITANGNIFIWENVFTPGGLEIKKGAGSVTFYGDSPINGNVKVTGDASFQGCMVNGNVEVTGSVAVRSCRIYGSVIGSGSSDTVTFAGAGGDNYLQGIQGVEKVVFSEQCNDLLIGGSGKVEFYNIENQTASDCNDGNREIYLSIEGYRKDSLPVFHKNFDLGISHVVNDEGTVDEWDAGIRVNYIETFDTAEGEEWKFIDVGAGNPSVKFADVSDVDILSMRTRMSVSGSNCSYGIDMDGTAVSNKEDDHFFSGFGYLSYGGMTAEAAFNRDFIQEIPYECLGESFRSNTLENMMRSLEADQKRGTGQGYYCVGLSRDYKGTLTVPSSITGVLYRGYKTYNEETDDFTFYPAQISSVDVPSGKAVRLFEMTGGTGILKITGAGKAALLNCRMNQDVTAGNLIVDGTTVKSLTCDKLFSERSWIAVEKSLKFNEANLLSSDIIAKAGATLNLGAINNAGTNRGDLAIDLEAKDGKTASVIFTKAFNLGNVAWDEGGTDEAWIDVRYYDYAKAASKGANCAKDFYSTEFSPWDDEGKNIYEVLTGFGNKAVSLMSFTAEATKSVEYMFSHMNVAYDGVTLVPMLEKADPQKVPLGTVSEDNAPKVTKTYFTVNSDVDIKNISEAVVSAISTQIYTGKSLTPAVTVKLNGKTLTKGTDYTVTYKNNKNVGTATVTITGIRNYTGTVTKKFTINYATPVLKKAAAKAGSITVSWKAVSGVKTYRVYRKSGSGGWKAVKDVKGTSYKDTKVKAGTTYSYTVRAMSGSKVASAYNKTGVKAVAYYAAPALSKAAAKAGSITISWKAVSGVKAYRVYRKSGSGSWKAVKDVKGTSYKDTSVKAGTKYTYTVQALSGSKAASAYKTAGISATAYYATPKLTSAKAVSKGIRVKWSAVSGAKTYQVYRKSGKGSWKALKKVTGTSYTDTTAKKGTTYTYTVRVLKGSTVASAFNTKGVSARR